MSKLLKITGIIWAGIGALNIILMFGKLGNGHETMGAFGLIFNFILFIAPGLGLAGLGTVLAKKGAPTEDKAVGRSLKFNKWMVIAIAAFALLVLIGNLLPESHNALTVAERREARTLARTYGASEYSVEKTWQKLKARDWAHDSIKDMLTNTAILADATHRTFEETVTEENITK
jgi:hypothetical protein